MHFSGWALLIWNLRASLPSARNVMLNSLISVEGECKGIGGDNVDCLYLQRTASHPQSCQLNHNQPADIYKERIESGRDNCNSCDWCANCGSVTRWLTCTSKWPCTQYRQQYWGKHHQIAEKVPPTLDQFTEVKECGAGGRVSLKWCVC